MQILPSSAIQLDEGEIFVEERQDEGNIWRTSKLIMPSGGVVTVQRHFSQIGPTIFRPDGRQIPTTVDHTGAVVPIEGIMDKVVGFKEED